MVSFAKWIGGGLGWVLGGPIGGLVGYALGSVVDNATTSSSSSSGDASGLRYNSSTAQGDFAISLLVLTAAVLKSDGKVVKAELDFVKNFLVSQFGAEQTKNYCLYCATCSRKIFPYKMCVCKFDNTCLLRSEFSCCIIYLVFPSQMVTLIRKKQKS